ncbi:MAG: exopolysaccharide biosynthesis polyprenyl glycosylphosphotransferase [Bacteroidales bacterium]|nr:exopolysaccharide biosynthesis polyprenyl glycosylphosphotransferase [Bacteroidales bacterium]
MKEKSKYFYLLTCNILITIIAVIPYVYVWHNYFNQLLFKEFLFKGNYAMYFVYAIFVVFFVNIFGGYKLDVSKKSNVLLSQCVGLLCVNFFEILITDLMVGYFWMIPKLSLYFLFIYLAQVVALFIFTVILMVVYRKLFPPYTVLLVVGEHQNRMKEKMLERYDSYQVAKEVSYTEMLENIEKTIKPYDIILLNDLPNEVRNNILKTCFLKNKKVYLTSKISDIIIRGAENLAVFDTPLLYTNNQVLTIPQRVIKRLADIFISLIGLIILSPLMILVSLAIFLYDRGPVFYRQTRYTVGGRQFKILKFRSMIPDAEKDGVARLAAENDDRITPVGKFIRACRIDELPQFINVLKGDMSIVGPRPERPEIADEYTKEVPEFAFRLRVKAGLTGFAQIYGKYNTTSYDKLKLDMMYVENCSLLMDLKLILLTLKVIFMKESTEGLEEGKTTATNKQ